MEIRPCNTDAEILTVYPAISQLYSMEKDLFLTYVNEMRATEYSLFGAFEGNNCIGAIGYRVGRRLYCGKYLHVDNLIVCTEHRNKGIAQQLIQFCKTQAQSLQCDVLLADSYVDNTPAQKLFLKENFYIRGFHLRCDNLN